MGLIDGFVSAVGNAASGAVSTFQTVAGAPAKLAEIVSDTVLPPELEAIGDVISGAMNYMSGNYVGAADDLGDLLAPTTLNLDGLANTGPPGVSPEPTEPVLQNTTLAGPAPGAVAAPAEPTGGTASTGTVAPDVGPAAGSATSNTGGATKSDGKGMSQAAKDFLNMSGPELMAAIRNGTIPDAIFDDPKAMNMLQMKIQHMSQMTGLLTQLSSAMHQMQQAIIHNVRA